MAIVRREQGPDGVRFVLVSTSEPSIMDAHDGDDLSILYVQAPPGITPADVQHRLATWQGLRDACEWITKIAGNLPDDRLTDRTGPNDAAARGLMVVEARRLANEALAAADRSKP